MGPTTNEIDQFDDIGHLVSDVWDQAKSVAGSIADPKLVSMILFKRLRENLSGYVVLWKAGHYVEAEIIVRSAVETAICIVANSKMGNEFPRLLRRDAAATLVGRIKIDRELGNERSIKGSEAALRFLQNDFSEGEKAAYLDFKALAEAGEVPLLYGFHKNLSGLSSHVTGLSVIRGIGDDETKELQDSLSGLSKRNYFNMIAGAVLHATLVQARMIDDAGLIERGLALVERMNALSFDWLSNEDGKAAVKPTTSAQV